MTSNKTPIRNTDTYKKIKSALLYNLKRERSYVLAKISDSDVDAIVSAVTDIIVDSTKFHVDRELEVTSRETFVGVPISSINYIKEDQFIKAIKELRSASGLGLRAAKEILEKVRKIKNHNYSIR